MAVHTVEIDTSRSAEEVYAALRRCDEFPSYAPDVVSVELEPPLSHWTLAFRGGTARWTQHDRFLPQPGLGAEFEQTSGDFVAFSGSWGVVPRGKVSTVRYQVSFSTSVAHLAGAIEPMVGRVLGRSARHIVAAVAGPTRIRDGAEVLNDGFQPH